MVSYYHIKLLWITFSDMINDPIDIAYIVTLPSLDIRAYRREKSVSLA